MDTEFHSEYAFVDAEKRILTFWEDNDSFHKLLEKNRNGKKYRFIDGPITANNPMGIHHTWGRSLKDIFLRYKAMNGYTSHYRNGFDGQGLWVEVEVEKELGTKTKKDIEAYGLELFTQRCIERVQKYSQVITQQSKRLGQWMDWDNSYYTYKDSNIVSIWAMLQKCHENGWIKQIQKPMPWCPRCGTSLSEHEMSGSYKEIEHVAVFAKVPLVGTDTDILVWTTTPWTLTSNVALAVHPEHDYVLATIDSSSRPLWMGKNYYEKKFAKDGTILEEKKGFELEDWEYETFFPDLPLQANVAHRIVTWEDVSSDDGCGVVHIAPGCGAEDFELGKTKNLDILIPIDENGIMLEDCGPFYKLEASQSRDVIFEGLQKQDKLLYTHPIVHSYPICWRCKTEVLFRCVQEWAIDVEELRPRLIANANTVVWNPAYQGKRMLDWLTNMGDWNISRKRFYGLPLPFYLCECGELTVIGSKEELRERAIEKEKVDTIAHLHRPWIDEIHIICPHCGKSITRIPEVGDVWLDAGIVPFSTLKYFEDRSYWNEYFPAEYVVEMKEQVRLWFYSMLFMSTVLEDRAPYEQVGTHGMVAAEDGSRFSKTGFMIQFDEAADKIGADASRYMFAQAPMTGDVRFGFNMGEEARRKLLNFWNLSTFFATYAEIDHPTVALTCPESLSALSDRWLVAVVNTFIEKATVAYQGYSTKDVVSEFEKTVDDVSNFYIRINRRRFWKAEDSDDKQTAYQVMMYAIVTISQIMAPIIPFLTEHIWQNLILRYGDTTIESIHLTDWPVATSESSQGLLESVSQVRQYISLALSARNDAKIRIRQPLQQAFIITDKPSFPQELEAILKSETNVKDLVYIPSTESLEQKYAVMDFKKAGAILRADVNTVKELLVAVSEDPVTVAAIESGSDVNLPGYSSPVSAEAFAILRKSKEGITIASENGLTIALDTTLTQELEQEGELRDLLRQCQILRKDSGFRVDDRIDIAFGESELTPLLKANEELIEKELLATIVPDGQFPFQTECVLSSKQSLSVKIRLRESV
jgi:isoleucyl-tRNA synthetase